MGSSNGPKGADGPKGSAICRLWPPLVVGAALLFMLSTSPDTTPPQARLGAGAVCTETELRTRPSVVGTW